jgi:hypothetical protein
LVKRGLVVPMLYPTLDCMKINEIRIGNWVRFDNNIEPAKFTQVNARFFCMVANGRPSQEMKPDEDISDYYQPIPLTPEILEKAGFEPYKYYSDTMSYKRDWFIWTKGWFQKGIKILNEDVKYLHQLQNIYFSLTNTELEIDATLHSQATTEEK